MNAIRTLMFTAGTLALGVGGVHAAARPNPAASHETAQTQPDVARMEQVIQSYVSAKQFMGSVLLARGIQRCSRRTWDATNSRRVST
jgi:hypothetical protein